LSNSAQPQPALTLEDFDYHLPDTLIAQFPAEQRTASRLLHLDAQGHLTDRVFRDIAQLLNPGDLLIFNDTRDIKARLHGSKASGGKIEALVERVTSTHEALAHVRASKSPKPGTALIFNDSVRASVVERDDDLFLLRFEQPVFEVLDAIGHVPLPPYITHEDASQDIERYQTVYARHPGAVAAPTAGLHFDQALLDQLSQQGISQAFVTLHVGAGTFRPVRDNDLSRHKMHAEWYTIGQNCVDAIEQTRRRGGRVIAVGTTSVRALESCAKANGGAIQPYSDQTQLFITPGFDWQVVDAMVTNFHLPKSTLLMLVAAFCGMQAMKQAYEHAVAHHYRFFSYGDAMFIERASQEKGTPHAV
jgi:S-adenosylmethionine:tRNA ribosyltransferase-isomerase